MKLNEENQFTAVAVTLFDELKQRIAYAKTAFMPIRSLYEVHGQIKMAFELKAITKEEYLELDHECVYKGINNPQYIKRENAYG